jgi:Tol biopolymer transport system component
MECCSITGHIRKPDVPAAVRGPRAWRSACSSCSPAAAATSRRPSSGSLSQRHRGRLHDGARDAPHHEAHDQPGPDFDPSLSPDGTKIALRSERDGNPEIYLIEGDGAHRRRVTATPGFSQAWTPDGKRIVFAEDTGGGLRSVAPDGTGERALPQTAGAVFPSLSGRRGSAGA